METVATIVTILVALGGAVAYLDRKIDGKIDSLRVDLKSDFHRLEHRVQGLDDRVFALALGMKPLIEQAQRHELA